MLAQDGQISGARRAEGIPGRVVVGDVTGVDDPLEPGSPLVGELLREAGDGRPVEAAGVVEAGEVLGAGDDRPGEGAGAEALGTGLMGTSQRHAGLSGELLGGATEPGQGVDVHVAVEVGDGLT